MIIFYTIGIIIILSIISPSLLKAFFNLIVELISFLFKIIFSKFIYVLIPSLLVCYLYGSKKINFSKLEHYIIPADTSILDLHKEHWALPLKHTSINSEYGMRHSKWHNGIDLKLKKGDPVLSTFDGYIKSVGFDKQGYGNYILIQHNNGFETLYGHLIKSNVSEGQNILAGDIIGFGGSTGHSTGEHLHFEVRYEQCSINPERIFNFKDNILR